MRTKYYLYLTATERFDVMQSLIQKKNELIKAGRYTDAVDDVLSKICNSRKKKVKIKYI